MMYRKSGNMIIRIADNAYIPQDPGNRDYADYLAWVAAGNQPMPEDKSALKRQELAVLATRYREDMQSLNANWLAAAVADGPSEIARKAAITASVTERKQQYAAETAAVIAKYQ